MNDETMSATAPVVDREVIRVARAMKRDIGVFRQTHPISEQLLGRPMPGFTWEALQRQLEQLAADPMKASMAGPLVSATRKQARFKPPEMVLREILCLASTLMDETFDASTYLEDDIS
jgi:hypothetical protein